MERIPVSKLKEELMLDLGGYLSDDREIGLVRAALEFASEAHDGQERDSGEAYIIHPINVALILTRMRMPWDVIAAALLHDTVEDCDVKVSELEGAFNADVARMVDGVTKLTQLDLQIADYMPVRSKKRHADEKARLRFLSLRKMIITASDDDRVLLIKLADRLHNMQTLSDVKSKKGDDHSRRMKQVRTARETMEIYAPIADRLGINDMKWRLEDLAFRYLDPKQYKNVSRLVKRKRREREQYASKAADILQNEILAKNNIQAEISGRAKHLYSIYKKKQRYEEQGRTFDDIHDLIALRVITASHQDCYNVLGVVHTMWTMVDGTFDDYISKPKENGYRSIHTTVYGPENMPLEVQIRSREMHVYAEDGVAAHWAYKEGASKSNISDYYVRATSWLKEYREVDDGSSIEHEESVESVINENLSQDTLTVYTPNGDEKQLPIGATPLDFAYRVHTDIGHYAIRAWVNKKLVPFNAALNTGDVVEIQASEKTSRGPSLDWLDRDKGFLASSSGRAKVRQWFNRQARETNMREGQRLMKRVIDDLRKRGQHTTPEIVAQHTNYASVDDLIIELGKGNEERSDVVTTVSKALSSEVQSDRGINGLPKEFARKDKPLNGRSLSNGVVVEGMSNMKINLPQCCSPVYGDEIVGFIRRGKDVSVHRTSCPNLRNEEDNPRIVSAAWGHSEDRYPVNFRIEGMDRIGFVSDISGVIKDEKINLHKINTDEGDKIGTTIVTFTAYITGVDQLAQLFSKLETVTGVYEVMRVG